MAAPVSRRGFLGGLALLTTAPGLILDSSKEIEKQQIEEAVAAGTSPETQVRLRARINAHWAMFGEQPKVLFVNEHEFGRIMEELPPTIRWTNTNMMKQGYDNLLFKGVPVACVDHVLHAPIRGITS